MLHANAAADASERADTLDAMRASRLLWELCDEALRVKEAIGIRYEHLDALYGRIRGLLTERKRKSATMGGIRIELVPVTEPWCRCHAASVLLCENVRAGKDTAVELRECEPRVRVTRTR